jgi:hypothetical protein
MTDMILSIFALVGMPGYIKKSFERNTPSSFVCTVLLP